MEKKKQMFIISVIHPWHVFEIRPIYLFGITFNINIDNFNMKNSNLLDLERTAVCFL